MLLISACYRTADEARNFAKSFYAENKYDIENCCRTCDSILAAIPYKVDNISIERFRNFFGNKYAISMGNSLGLYRVEIDREVFGLFANGYLKQNERDAIKPIVLYEQNIDAVERIMEFIFKYNIDACAFSNNVIRIDLKSQESSLVFSRNKEKIFVPPVENSALETIEGDFYFLYAPYR